MISEKDLENISSIVSLADAYFSCKPKIPCEVAATLIADRASAGGTEPVVSEEETYTNQDAAVNIATQVTLMTVSPVSGDQQASPVSSTEQAAPVSAAAKDGSSTTSDDAASSLQNIARKIASCTRCRLCGGRKNTVPGIGVPHPLVLVIGEGPGADEDASGEPFVGKAGQLLDKMLGAICLSRHTNCFIANIVKCRPPNNRDPMPDEADACRAFLDAQIGVLKPKMILAVGRIAAQNILNTTTGINRLRGQFYEYRGIPLLPTYHPSALLRNEEMKRPAWEDLKLFRSRLEEITGLSFSTPPQTGRNG